MHSLVDTVIVEKADARPDTGYRVSGRSPNWSAPPSARRISNANATRVVLLEISRPRLSFRRNHARFLPLSNLYLCPPRLLVLPLLSFLPFLFDTLTVGKESRDIPDIFAFSDSTAGSILLGEFLSVVFCGEHR